MSNADRRRVYAERRAAGLCSYCGKHPNRPNECRCDDCRDSMLKRYVRNGRPVGPVPVPAIDRLMSKVTKTETCWVFTGTRNKMGYGRIGVSGNRVELAHRVSYETLVGPIPEGLWVLHRCDNPPCVRPDHLFLGTHQDNMDDMIKKGRHWYTKRLTIEQRTEILRLHESGDYTHEQLATLFGIGRTGVGFIIKSLKQAGNSSQPS